jgi:photosystem II stability/assembly factor-like uncharacterized protein
MQNKKIFTLFFTLLFVSAVYSQSGWFQQSPLPTSNPLFSAFFINQNTGYAVGQYGTIVKTTNGGNLWFILESGTNQYLVKVFFTDINTGYIAGGNGLICTGSAENGILCYLKLV